MFKDTDLLTYHVETEDNYADMLRDTHHLDLITDMIIHVLIVHHQIP